MNWPMMRLLFGYDSWGATRGRDCPFGHNPWSGLGTGQFGAALEDYLGVKKKLPVQGRLTNADL